MSTLHIPPVEKENHRLKSFLIEDILVLRGYPSNKIDWSFPKLHENFALELYCD